MKAAQEAKATVTGLESQLSALKAAQAGTIPQAKGAFDGPIAATQNALDAAKKNAADKEAAAKGIQQHQEQQQAVEQKIGEGS